MATILLRLEQTPDLRSCSSRKSIVAAAKDGGGYASPPQNARPKGSTTRRIAFDGKIPISMDRDK
ncbi:hypothetical protein [Hymenobacter chitinivorans]|uniref:hypothetical protein n=1 Tax=Hymenobacter chitinivorans TaxID=89969 RepID=UPI0012FD68A6|nr:hypothetical protein [Hymenobacter chitinivorans]